MVCYGPCFLFFLYLYGLCCPTLSFSFYELVIILLLLLCSFSWANPFCPELSVFFSTAFSFPTNQLTHA
jgi:hypothetical protein